MNFKSLLDRKSRILSAVAHDLPVEDAARLMIREKTPALMVLRDEEPVGLVTGNDILRCWMESGGTPSANKAAGDIATGEWVAADAHDEIAGRLATMLRADTEWITVVEDGRIIGLLGLKDLMRHQIGALDAEIETLREYVSCLQDAMRD
jgi:signal-transduction protein with cAMP-binding, CBS, and nucleotidyltransferase domain